MIFSEIVVVGREILQGRVLDTNSNWIAIQLRNLGIRVRRIFVVDDVKEEIIDVVHSIVARKPNIAIFTGGLGPTFDDITTSSVAEALGLELVEDELALKYIAEMCSRRNLPLTKERRKMALLPRGAKALKNEIGMAPGVYFKHNNIDFFLLPGVPVEMKYIFENEVLNYLKNLEGREFYKEIYIEVHGIPESDLAPIIKSYKEKYEPVYIKSHPRGYESGLGYIVLHLSIFTGEEKELKLLDELKEDLIENLKNKAKKIAIVDSLK
jgi:molybdenum cofactor synthesis domain-containing protein